MNMKSTRRSFLRIAGVGIAASQTPGILAAGISSEHKSPGKYIPFKLGIASYTLRELSLEDTIAITQRLGITRLALKSMHLPLESTSEEINHAIAKINEAGIDLYGAGVIYMKSKEEVDKAFEYAKLARLTTIIGVPNHELLGYCSEKVKEYDIMLAIHNHGPGDDLYPSPKSVYDKINDLDWRIGLCVDIGHTQRIGQDPIKETKKYMDRVYDIHIKDVDKAEAEGETIEIGRGVIDIPGFLEMLVEEHYARVVSFEHEKDGDDPFPGLAESVGYVRGVLDTLE